MPGGVGRAVGNGRPYPLIRHSLRLQLVLNGICDFLHVVAGTGGYTKKRKTSHRESRIDENITVLAIRAMVRRIVQFDCK